MKKITKYLTISATVLSLGFATIAVSAQPTYAACTESNKEACAKDLCKCDCVDDNIKRASGCPDAGEETADITNVIQNIITGVVLALGTVAVGFIVFGGVQYMTSSGDASKVKKAKDTIIYATIGLVIAALAFAITNFAIGIINDDGTSSTSGSSTTTGGGSAGTSSGSSGSSIPTRSGGAMRPDGIVEFDTPEGTTYYDE